MRGLVIVRHEPQETIKGPRVAMRRDKRTLSLTPNQHIFSSHFINGFADRPLADIETRCQFPFTRYCITRPPLALLQATNQEILDLAIEGAESRGA